MTRRETERCHRRTGVWRQASVNTLPADNGTIGVLTPGPLTAQLSGRSTPNLATKEGGPRHRYSCRCSEITRCQPRWHRGRLGNTPDGCGHGHGDAGSRSRAFLPDDGAGQPPLDRPRGRRDPSGTGPQRGCRGVHGRRLRSSQGHARRSCTARTGRGPPMSPAGSPSRSGRAVRSSPWCPRCAVRIATAASTRSSSSSRCSPRSRNGASKRPSRATFRGSFARRPGTRSPAHRAPSTSASRTTSSRRSCRATPVRRRSTRSSRSRTAGPRRVQPTPRRSSACSPRRAGRSSSPVGASTSPARTRRCVSSRSVCRIPVATSNSGKGSIAETHDLALGSTGRYSRNYANAALRDADVILAVGTALGGMVTDSYKLVTPGTRVIHVSIDAGRHRHELPDRDRPRRRRPNIPGGGPRRGDPARGAALAGSRRPRHDARGRTSRLARAPPRACCPERPGRFTDAARGDHGDARSAARRRRRPRRRHRLLIGMGWRLVRDQAGRAGTSSGRMARSGWAFPAALGAQLAVPDRQVVCITGDGGFGYHIGDIETAIRHELPVIVVILNNQTLAFEEHVQTMLYGKVVPEVNEFVDINYGSDRPRLRRERLPRRERRGLRTRARHGAQAQRTDDHRRGHRSRVDRAGHPLRPRPHPRAMTITAARVDGPGQPEADPTCPRRAGHRDGPRASRSATRTGAAGVRTTSSAR